MFWDLWVDIYYTVLGFVFSIVAGLLIGPITNALRGETGGRGWITRLQGSVEQVMYTASYMLGSPEFIAVWLGVKTATQWQAWTRHTRPDSLFDELLAPYLLGNALSVTLAVTASLTIQWAIRGDVHALLAPVLVFAGILVIRIWVRIRTGL